MCADKNSSTFFRIVSSESSPCGLWCLFRQPRRSFWYCPITDGFLGSFMMALSIGTKIVVSFAPLALSLAV